MENIKLNDAQQQFVDSLLKSLEEERIPWQRPWFYVGMTQHNPVSGVKYKGTNQLMLEMYGNMREQSDPRWCTFNQAKEKGWRIKKGAKSVKIFYPLLWNDAKKKFLGAEDFKGLSTKEAEELKEESSMRLKYFSVFNGEDIVGIPKLKENTLKGVEFNNTYAERVAKDIITGMPIDIVHKNQDRAYYYMVPGTTEDGIMMPLKEQFLSEESYYGTLFHELSHATGSPMRLARESIINRSKKSYSEEELVAEFSSIFLSKDLGFSKPHSEQEEMSASYIQGWHDAIKKDPTIIFKALKNASASYKYLYELGNVKQIQNELEEIENQKVDYAVLVRDVSIKDYAQDVLGLNVVPKGRGLFSTQEHDSLIIYDNSNDFYRYSASVGGNLISFIEHFESVDKETAIQKATDYYHQVSPEVRALTKKPLKEKIEGINLPEKDNNNSSVQAYLIKERSLPLGLVNDFIKEGILYQDEKKNAVFVGHLDGSPLYATRRGTMPNSTFKGDVGGSIKEVGVFKSNKSDTLILTESCIDMMSYMTLQPDAEAYDYLSVNGVSNAKGAFNFHMYKREESENYKQVVIAFDNDKAGEEATLDMIDFVKENFPTLEVFYIYPNGKDWNEDLIELEKKRGSLTSDSQITDHKIYMGKGLGYER